MSNNAVEQMAPNTRGSSAKDKLIVALDVERSAEALSLFHALKNDVGMFKIGSQLFTAAGPRVVREIVEAGGHVFLDLKFHDIPNTVAAAGVEAARLGVSIFNVHAAGGSEMMKRTLEAVNEVCARERLTRPRVIAVTVLTSADRETLAETGFSSTPEEQVRRLASLAATCGMDGVVASPRELRLVRDAVGREDFLVVTPGVRPGGDVRDDDQKRVMTPLEAVRAGANYLVVGRPILQAQNPASAARLIVREMESAAS